jgi:hypothetical protein
MRLALLLMAFVSLDQPSACEEERMRLWNEFAADANAYTRRAVVDLKRDAKTREKLNREWAAVNRCECW